MTEIVDLVIEDERWSSIGLGALAERAASLALTHADCPTHGYEIGLLACNDARILELNAEYRGKDRATSVLSWPTFDLASALDGNKPKSPPNPSNLWAETLGDLAISYDTCAKEALEQRLSLHDHATHLILHGCLHLLGYDHQREGDAALMEGLESKALATIGIADPY